MNDIIILDGGMGTELQARGLAPGERLRNQKERLSVLRNFLD